MDRREYLYWFNSPAAVAARQAYFMVLTSGNCGAIWFAAALNLHPDIFAGCGIDHPIESCFRYDLKKSGAALLHASTDRNFRFGAHPEVMRRVLDEQAVSRSFQPRDYTRLSEFVFEELEELPGVAQMAALGSVHTFTALHFAQFHDRSPALLGSRRVVVTNMIRHPVPRIEAVMKAFMQYQLAMYQPTLRAYRESHADECRALEATYGISMDDPRVQAVIFVYRIGHTVAWVANELRTYHDMVALRFEDLQEDRDYFAAAVALLTSGRVTADASYLDDVFRPENLGVGRRSVPDGTRPVGARAQWEAWSDFERAEFRATYVRDDIQGAYAGHGYDFSFVK